MYVNFLDSYDGSSRLGRTYADATYRRLAEVKVTYDPDNAFHTTTTSVSGEATHLRR